MRYIHKTLLDNEQIIYVTNPHWIVYLPSMATLVVAFAFLIFGHVIPVLNFYIYSIAVYQIFAILFGVIGLYTLLKAYIFHRTSEYGITNKRILMKMGWLERNSLELFLDKIEAVHVDQTIPGRLLGYGSIIVIGTGGSRDPFINVPRPLHFRKVVQQEIDHHDEHMRSRSN